MRQKIGIRVRVQTLIITCFLTSATATFPSRSISAVEASFNSIGSPSFKSKGVLKNQGSQSDAIPQDARLLEPGKTIEREIVGQESHLYQITLAINQYSLLVVYKQGVDVLLRIIGPDGQKIALMQPPNGTRGSIRASLMARTSGIYKVEVISSGRGAPAGRYGLMTEMPREATEQDLGLFAAQNKYMEAVVLVLKREDERAIPEYEKAAQLFHNAGSLDLEAYTLTEMGDSASNSSGDKKRAIDYYFRALSLGSKVNDPSWQAYTLNNIGQAYRSLGDKQQELEYYLKALPLWIAGGDLDGQATTLYNAAWVYNEQGKKSEALNSFNQALDIRRAISDRNGEATLLSGIGAIQDSLGEKQLALDRFKECAPIFHALKDHQGEASSLSYIAKIYSDLGENSKALDFLKQAIVIRNTAKDKRGEAITLSLIGKVYSDLGEKQQALIYYNNALATFRELRDSDYQARMLINIGVIYQALGNDLKALNNFNEALKLAREAKKALVEARAQFYTGRSHLGLGHRQEALDVFNEALRLFNSLDDRIGKGITLNNIGQIYFELNDRPKAIDLYQQALKEIHGSGYPREEAIVLINIGSVYDSAGDKQAALGLYNRALQLNLSAGYQSGEANNLYHIARAERDRGDLSAARTHIDQALTIIESLRVKVEVQELRATYLASVYDYYDLNVDILMRMHKLDPSKKYNEAALQVSERGRARTLLEMLAEARADIHQGIDPVLFKRKQELNERLTGLAQRKVLSPADKSDERQAAIDRDISTVTTEYQQVEARIRTQSPRYSALSQPQTLTKEQIQQQLLEPNDLLLEYALGNERSYLWAVTSASIVSFELPNRADVERRARGVYRLLSARNQQGPKFETSEEKQTRVAQADKEYVSAAAELSELLLGPVAAQLGEKRLIIVADGALHYIPYATLPSPSPAGDGQGNVGLKKPVASDWQPLIARNEIVSLPSASTLAVLRQQLRGRMPAPRFIAVLADPVFSTKDKRLRNIVYKAPPDSFNGSDAQGGDQAASIQLDVKRPLMESGLRSGEYERLISTRKEAAEIVALAPAALCKQALDFDASRATAMGNDLGLYRYIHFATHGVLDGTNPELSGIVLSLVDQKGKEQNGFLLAHEVFNLKLPAELVVLSACQTGLGKEIKGEGLIGLTRAFMYAGAARVIASLWYVDDFRTAQLMAELYKNMLGKQRLRPSAALRQAQLTMWRAGLPPYYWAAFIIQGEPR
jgi:CHAT domain-containing protein/predicted negative regulator of RcsB-dependent stress response